MPVSIQTGSPRLTFDLRLPSVFALLAIFAPLRLEAQKSDAPGRLIKEERLVAFGKDGVATVRVSIHIPPPFYKGPVPFTYTAGIRGYGGQFGMRWVEWADYGGFRVSFKRDSTFTPLIPGRARAVGRDGALLAEARATRLIPGTGFEVRETHYGPENRTIFECLSLFDFGGSKMDETSQKGRKLGDYFFYWSSER